MRQFEVREDHNYGTVGLHSTKAPHYLGRPAYNDELLVDACPSINVRQDALLDLIDQLLGVAIADGQFSGPGRHIANALRAEIALNG